ncbi:MAG: hypothetical protein KGH65_03905 [Candidatus Micrarchaeota archaeon]|nr:hypothetical protein [Candidatus Micrarchaeota archaeon]
MAISRDDFRNLDKFNQKVVSEAFKDPATSEAMQRFVKMREEDQRLLGKLNNHSFQKTDEMIFVIPGSGLSLKDALRDDVGRRIRIEEKVRDKLRVES